MYKNNDVEIWLSISQGLFRDLKPDDAGAEIIGCKMPPEKFAELTDRETQRVTDVLIAMSLAENKFEVRNIFKTLSHDTVIVLFSRWAHFHEEWTKMLYDQKPPLRMPPRDMWRAIFLELSGNQEASSKAARLIWGEEFLK